MTVFQFKVFLWLFTTETPFKFQRRSWPHRLLHRVGRDVEADRGEGRRQRLQLPQAHQVAAESSRTNGGTGNSPFYMRQGGYSQNVLRQILKIFVTLTWI